MRRYLWLLATLALLPLGGTSQPQDKDKDKDAPKEWITEFECRWADTAITIDGKDDDAAWKNAQVIDQFYLPWLGKNARLARTATKAKVLWDRDNFYFFADMEDADPYDDKAGYYEFQVNAANAVLDMFIPRRNAGGYERFKKDGDFHIESKVQLR